MKFSTNPEGCGRSDCRALEHIIERHAESMPNVKQDTTAARITNAPAKIVSRVDGLGALAVGAPADIAPPAQDRG